MRGVGALLLAAVLALPPRIASAAIPIVAAENFYGDIARQIGGDQVHVTAILSNPDTDPHLFEASPSVARAFAGARIVIISGVGYDPWAERLAGGEPSSRANRDCRGIADREGDRRQSAHLVRSGHHACGG